MELFEVPSDGEEEEEANGAAKESRSPGTMFNGTGVSFEARRGVIKHGGSTTGACVGLVEHRRSVVGEDLLSLPRGTYLGPNLARS